MKNYRAVIAILLTLMLTLSLCGCGSTSTPETQISTAQTPYSMEYTGFCAKFSAAYLASILGIDGEWKENGERYVAYDEIAGNTVTLNSDGTGYLYLGEDNKGPIDSWSLNGTALQFKAGVSTFNGTIEDGFMTLKIEEGFSLCFVAPGTDTSQIQLLSVEEFVSQLLGVSMEDGETQNDKTFSAVGEYTLFGVENEGFLLYAQEAQVTSSITLKEEGGSITANGDTVEISSWTEENGEITCVLTDGSTAKGPIHNGIIELDLLGTGDVIFYYAQQGADISSYPLMTLEEAQTAYMDGMSGSPLNTLLSGLDTKAGVHLRYDLRTEYQDATQSMDVHGKDGVFYSARVIAVSGYENTTVTYFRDGKTYVLYPDKMTGNFATATSASMIKDNVMLLDPLYMAIWSHAQDNSYTEEMRERDGVSYRTLVYPATSYKAESALYFGADGELAFYIEGAPVVESAVKIGESVYTVYAIDGSVDETLFDVSGYQISE